MNRRYRTKRHGSRSLHVMQWLGQALLAGLGVFLPLAITVYLIGWALVAAEQVTGGLVKAVLPDDWTGDDPYYIPGLGIAVIVMVVFLLGVALRTFNMQRVLDWEDRTLRRIPLVRTLYSSIKDIGQYFIARKDEEMGQAVIVTLPETSVQMLGFMTRTDGRNLDGYELVSDPVMVYLPMSYQIGGFLVVVPRTAVQPLQLPFDEAMSFVFMAGMKDIGTRPAEETPPPVAPEPRKRPPAQSVPAAKSRQSKQRT